MEPIATIRSDFPEKFGVPRQAGLVPQLIARVEFLPDFRSDDAVRGLTKFSHLWLIWECSLSKPGWSPTVRPPRLGGNRRMGVFATRSPQRPNPIGLSCVRLLSIEPGPVLVVGGADLVDGTPILDVKPYVPTDCVDTAQFGFIQSCPDHTLEVHIPGDLAAQLGSHAEALRGVLSQDPRPGYRRSIDEADTHEYGVAFACWNVRFVVETGQLRVVSLSRLG